MSLTDDDKQWFQEQIAASELRTREHVYESENRLLGEFWKWARTADARYRTHQGTVAGLEERVLIVEDRVAELERGNGGGEGKAG